jgi:hypothetical protein
MEDRHRSGIDRRLPVAATAIRLRSADYYADLARTVRRGESFDLESLLAHLNTVGYTSTDVVEMPGQYAVARRHPRRLLPRGRSPAAHRVFRRRSRFHSQVRSRLAALFDARRRSLAPSAHRNPGQRTSARRNSYSPQRQTHYRQRRNRRSRRPRRWSQRLPRLGVLFSRRRS